jgi:hypothetical protein
MIRTYKQKKIETINTKNEKCNLTAVFRTFFNISTDTRAIMCLAGFMCFT